MTLRRQCPGEMWIPLAFAHLELVHSHISFEKAAKTAWHTCNLSQGIPLLFYLNMCEF